MKTCSVVLTFESVDEILLCDYSHETFLAVLLHGTICFSILYKMNFTIFYEFRCLALFRVGGLRLLEQVAGDALQCTAPEGFLP